MHPSFQMRLFQGHIVCYAVKDNHLNDDEYRMQIHKTLFSDVEYKGKKYMSKYFDGCFKPFIVEQI